MATITFAAGTVIPSTWLNDVNAIVYGSASPPANPIRVDVSGNVGIGVIPSTNTHKVQINGSLAVTSVFGAGFTIAGGGLYFDYGSAVSRAYIGDGTGYEFRISKRIASTTTDLVTFGDSGSLLVVGSGGLGYGTGSGGTVTQTVGKTTTVTLNKTNGQIVMNNSSLAPNTTVQFLCNNSTVTDKDVVIITQNEAISGLNYNIWAAVGSGYIRFQVRNISSGALAEAITINFAVIKAVTA